MARRRLVLKNTALFSEPANLSWERYVVMQARERERYLAERAAIPEDVLNYKTVSPRYLENAVDQFANNYYSELSATHYVATAAANAPFDELKKSALFQLADEQRHLEMDREVFERAGIPERDWLAAWGVRRGGKDSSRRTTRSPSRWGFVRPFSSPIPLARPASDRHSNRGQESPSGEPGSSNPETSDFLELPRLTASYRPPATGMAIAGKTVALCAFWSSTTIRLSARSSGSFSTKSATSRSSPTRPRRRSTLCARSGPTRCFSTSACQA